MDPIENEGYLLKDIQLLLSSTCSSKRISMLEIKSLSNNWISRKLASGHNCPDQVGYNCRFLLHLERNVACKYERLVLVTIGIDQNVACPLLRRNMLHVKDGNLRSDLSTP
ncbi:hypothetical protein AC1031_014159 [Aphanomyces cochlioides]|nr:hypothetical protein AC1031_014159 [Aphanomyces cochlioides]